MRMLRVRPSKRPTRSLCARLSLYLHSRSSPFVLCVLDVSLFALRARHLSLLPGFVVCRLPCVRVRALFVVLLSVCVRSLRVYLCVRSPQLPEGGICLDAADIQYGEDKLKRKYVFCILTPDRTYFIQASGDAEIQDWMQALKRITDACQKRRMVDYADPRLR